MAHEAVLSFEYDTREMADRVASAIAPELGDIDDDRSSVRSERDGRELRILVIARDPVALRASLNTWLSLVDVAEQTGDSK